MKQGWEIIPFEDSIVKVKYTTKIPSNDYLEQGLYPIVSQEEGLISGYWNNEEDVFKVPSPVVIFGDHTRILKFVDFDFVLGADGVKILQPIENINAKFFKLYLESCKIPSLGYSRHYKLLKELQIPIPPREEQERIVEILDREFEKIDALKENAEKNLQHAKDLFQSALKQELQPKEGWKISKLSEVVRVINGRAYSKEELLTSGKYRVLRVGNFFTNDSWYYSDLELEKDKYCEDGDLLYAWSASFGPKIWNGEKVIYHYHIWKMVPNCTMDKLFLFYWLQSPHLTNQVMSNLHGTTMVHITKGIMESTTIQFPKLQEQKTIVDRLDKLKEHCNTLEENYTKTIALCDDMKQALLRKAFNGEL